MGRRSPAKLVIMIRQSPRLAATAPPPAAPSSDSSSESDSESFTLDKLDDGESLTDIMEDLKEQMTKIVEASTEVRGQVKSLFKRAKRELVEWMEEPMRPRTAAVKAWLAAHDLPPQPTLTEFLKACYAAATSLDLESRVITFNKKDAAALWDGEQRLTVFDLVARLPTVFE